MQLCARNTQRNNVRFLPRTATHVTEETRVRQVEKYNNHIPDVICVILVISKLPNSNGHRCSRTLLGNGVCH